MSITYFAWSGNPFLSDGMNCGWTAKGVSVAGSPSVAPATDTRCSPSRGMYRPIRLWTVARKRGVPSGPGSAGTSLTTLTCFTSGRPRRTSLTTPTVTAVAARATTPNAGQLSHFFLRRQEQVAARAGHRPVADEEEDRQRDQRQPPAAVLHPLQQRPPDVDRCAGGVDALVPVRVARPPADLFLHFGRGVGVVPPAEDAVPDVRPTLRLHRLDKRLPGRPGRGPAGRLLQRPGARLRFRSPRSCATQTTDPNSNARRAR